MGRIQKNTYRMEGDVAYVICKNGFEIKIDAQDLPRVQDKVCTFRPGRGAFYKKNRKDYSLARFLFGPTSFRVLHLNSDPADCRQENLFSGNRFIKDGESVRVECFDGRYFLIDHVDQELVSKYVWHIDSNGYIMTKIQGRGIKLHRYLMNASDNQEVDHISRDPLDNRRSNLRLVNRSLNCLNRCVSQHNKAGYKGVYRSQDGKWHAQISYNGKKLYLGTYSCCEDAIAARLNAEKSVLPEAELQISGQDPNRVRFNDHLQDVDQHLKDRGKRLEAVSSLEIKDEDMV